MANHTTATYDLHNHTYWSFDGSVPVERYFQKARELGVGCFCVSEHQHCFSADDLAAIAGQHPEVKVIRAAEITADTSLGPVDLLCYGLPENRGPRLRQLLAKGESMAPKTGEMISALFQDLGIPYDGRMRREALLTYKPGHVIDRTGITHVRSSSQRDFFLAQGWVKTVEAYDALNQKVTAQLVRPPWPKAAEVVEAVRESGGLIVLAHPTIYCNGADERRMDTFRRECDLDGFESAHPRIPAELTPVYRAYCQRHQLVSTAGSDTHFCETLDTGFARHGGEESWFEEFIERLRAVQPDCFF